MQRTKFVPEMNDDIRKEKYDGWKNAVKLVTKEV